MDDNIIDLKLTIDQLGGFDMESFGGRIAIQKKIYLLQLSGLDLGYRFNWYIRGPYSPGLADTAFDIWNNLDVVTDITNDYTLTDTAIKKIDKIKPLLESPCPSNMEEYGWLELLASLHYICHIAFLPDEEKKDKEKLCGKLKELKPNYSMEEIHEAWDCLNKFGLIDNKLLE